MPDDSPRLYLITPAKPDAASFPALLEAALEAGDVACLLADTGSMTAEEAERIITACKPTCMRNETALLVRDVQKARGPAIDGVHISTRNDDLEKQLDDAVKKLKPDFIVGAGGLRNRHAAMSAGERDIDYVMFGEPAPDGYVPPFEQIEERTAWWSEIFNVPCVAYAEALENVAPLVTAGADFIALREAVWNHPDGPASAVRTAIKLIQSAPARAGTVE